MQLVRQLVCQRYQILFYLWWMERVLKVCKIPICYIKGMQFLLVTQNFAKTQSTIMFFFCKIDSVRFGKIQQTLNFRIWVQNFYQSLCDIVFSLFPIDFNFSWIVWLVFHTPGIVAFFIGFYYLLFCITMFCFLYLSIYFVLPLC